MSWPLLRNDRAAARRLRLVDYAVAFVVAWLGPLVVGGVLYGVFAAANLLVGADDLSFAPMFGFALVLIMLPMFSWAGLLPGILLLRLMARAGWGGLLPVMVAGFVLGWLVGALPGGVSPLSVFSLFGILLAGAAWFALRLVRPAAMTPPA